MIACNVGQGAPLDDGELDVAVFSLSLMGANTGDYLREAARTLVFDGRLIICEPTQRLPDRESIRERLERLGFNVTDIMADAQFTFIRAVRTDADPNPDATLL